MVRLVSDDIKRRSYFYEAVNLKGRRRFVLQTFTIGLSDEQILTKLTRREAQEMAKEWVVCGIRPSQPANEGRK